MAKVTLENVTKMFGDTVAVRDLSLKIKNREFLVLLGPSGCGKTTTLRMIAGLETPTKGVIYIDDKDVTETAPKDRDIAMVFQSYALYPHKSVKDNIAFPLKMHKYPKNEIILKVKHTASLLRIDHLLERKPKQLSGGEAQRVALGRAIVREPKVFLMDEPLSNLDAKLRVLMRAELKALQKEIGITTIYVTHDQLEAMTMSDRIMIMNQGIPEQLGLADDLFFRPSSLFVASFLGTPPMNLIDCSFMEKKGKAYLESPAFTLNVSDWRNEIKEKSSGSEMIFGIRPENIALNKKKPMEYDASGEVFVVEPAGSEVIVDVSIGGGLWKVKTSPGFRTNKGEDVWLKFDMPNAHIFDKKTEKTII